MPNCMKHSYNSAFDMWDNNNKYLQMNYYTLALIMFGNSNSINMLENQTQSSSKFALHQQYYIYMSEEDPFSSLFSLIVMGISG